MKPMLRCAFLASCLVTTTGVPAWAQGACDGAVEKTRNDWQAIRLQPASKPGAMSQGVDGHKHNQAAVDSMRFHMSTAIELCKARKDHESMLHLDIVRAFLSLPEIQHPTDHRFLFDDKSK